MDTHLTLINEDVVREREAALRASRERADAASLARIPVQHRAFDEGGGGGPEPGAGMRDADAASRARTAQAHAADVAAAEEEHHPHRGADLLVFTLFAVLGAGFVALVVATLQI